MSEDSYILEDDEELKKTYTMWNLVPRIMVMPTSGWKRLMDHGPLPEVAGIRFLLPLCILSALAQFFVYAYNVQLVFADVLVGAVITFCQFFLGYFLALVLLKLALPKDTDDFADTQFARLMIMTGIGTLAFFHILFMALPMLDFILEFLPLWTVYILYEGMRIKTVSPSKQSYAIGAVCVIVICAPFAIEWLLALFM